MTAQGAAAPALAVGCSGWQAERMATGGDAQATRGQPPRQGPGDDRGGRGFSFAKAIVLVLAAIALGAYLLQLGNGSGAPAATTTPTSSTPPSPVASTTTTAPSSTSTTLERPTHSVTVLVANASSTNGVAAAYTHELASDGWGTLTPVTALTTASTSTVYYATGQQPAAAAIASALGLSSTAVQPLGPTVPLQSTAGADVVLVVGADLAAKAPGGAG